jgi:hypothetical protein
MATGEYLTPAEIREAFVREAQRSPDGRLRCCELASRLRHAGLCVRGDSPKRQRDSVYSALIKDPERIERCGPGEFRLR